MSQGRFEAQQALAYFGSQISDFLVRKYPIS
jgi:hypothetical protein